MQLRHWLRPPRQLLVVFLAVALMSAGAVGWLGWLLLKQDAALDVQRRQERLDQAADRAAAAMQRSIADLQAHANPPLGPNVRFPPGVSGISIRPGGGVTAWPEGSLLYYPVSGVAPLAPSQTFADGERLEYSGNDLAGAARVYSKSAAAGDPAVRAGALARLARVRRKLGDADAALRAYDQLAQIEHADVEGLPAALVARAGRASVFEETSRPSELRQEADALQRDIRRGRWQLVKAEYEFYSSQASAWLDTKPADALDALARADAAGWLWQNRASLDSMPRRSIALPSGPALVVWQSLPERLYAVVAGPTYLASLCSEVVPSDLRCALSDSEGRTLIGDRPPARMVAVRAASAAGLPWTLHLFGPSEAEGIAPSPRRRLLVLVFAVVALVLATGWYFILRAMSRELRVSRLQSDFVAAVSHEFRSPLTSLSHIAEMLAGDRIRSVDDRRKSYDVLVRDTDRLRRLVEGLLDFGRFEAGAAALRLEPLDITDLVRSTVAEFQERVAPDGYSIEMTDDGSSVHACADREALSRALWNLLDNAVKYSPDCRTVWVDMTHDDDRVSIVIRDRGLGIPAHEQREIFDRFVRGADSKARRIRGTGIGLAMVREIVRAHGGEIQVASEPGRGSRFTMVLRSAGGVA